MNTKKIIFTVVIVLLVAAVSHPVLGQLLGAEYQHILVAPLVILDDG